jgi:hypothetical protein
MNLWIGQCSTTKSSSVSSSAVNHSPTPLSFPFMLAPPSKQNCSTSFLGMWFPSSVFPNTLFVASPVMIHSSNDTLLSNYYLGLETSYTTYHLSNHQHLLSLLHIFLFYQLASIFSSQ